MWRLLVCVSKILLSNQICWTAKPMYQPCQTIHRSTYIHINLYSWTMISMSIYDIKTMIIELEFMFVYQERDALAIAATIRQLVQELAWCIRNPISPYCWPYLCPNPQSCLRTIKHMHTTLPHENHEMQTENQMLAQYSLTTNIKTKTNMMITITAISRVHSTEEHPNDFFVLWPFNSEAFISKEKLHVRLSLFSLVVNEAWMILANV